MATSTATSTDDQRHPSASSGGPIRVLLWSPKGSGLHYGGPGTSAYRLYGKAAPGRFRITLAHGFAGHEPYDLFADQHLVAPLGAMSPLEQWRFVRRGVRWLDAHAGAFDVFHGLQGFHLTVRPAVEAQRQGLPAVVKIAAHQTDLTDKGGWKQLLGLPARRRRMLIDGVSAVIAISDAIADELKSYGVPDEKIARIPNGVDTDQFRPADPTERPALRRTLGWRDEPAVLFVGGLTRRKNPHVLVEALALLHRRGHACQLVLAGPAHDAAYVDDMKARAAELRVGDHVVWAGFTHDVAPLYRAADVYCLPSSNEGMPNALLEAMASGLACVATPISGSADVVADGTTGRLVAADAEPTAEAVGAYLADASLARQHGQAARENVLSRFSARFVLDAHEALFRRVMAGSR